MPDYFIPELISTSIIIFVTGWINFILFSFLITLLDMNIVICPFQNEKILSELRIILPLMLIYTVTPDHFKRVRVVSESPCSWADILYIHRIQQRFPFSFGGMHCSNSDAKANITIWWPHALSDIFIMFQYLVIASFWKQIDPWETVLWLDSLE